MYVYIYVYKYVYIYMYNPPTISYGYVGGAAGTSVACRPLGPRVGTRAGISRDRAFLAGVRKVRGRPKRKLKGERDAGPPA